MDNKGVLSPIGECYFLSYHTYSKSMLHFSFNDFHQNALIFGDNNHVPLLISVSKNGGVVYTKNATVSVLDDKNVTITIGQWSRGIILSNYKIDDLYID